jgi:hypothetical protein
VGSGNANDDLNRLDACVAAAYLGTHNKSGEARCEILQLVSRSQRVGRDDFESAGADDPSIGYVRW